jgi:hypothetical protein
MKIMNTRTRRFVLAFLLLLLAWPGMGAAVAAVLGWLLAFPAVVFTTVAVVLLLSTVNGPVERALTRLANARSTRTASRGAA